MKKYGKRVTAILISLIMAAATAGYSSAGVLSAEDPDTTVGVEDEENNMSPDENVDDEVGLTADGFCYRILSKEEKTAEIIGYLGFAENEISIPDTVDGYAVVKITGHIFGDLNFKEYDRNGTVLRIGESKTYQLFCVDKRLDFKGNSWLTWTVGDKRVAEVDGNGTVTGLSAGETDLTATTWDGGILTTKIRVLPRGGSGLDTTAPVINSVRFAQTAEKGKKLTISVDVTEEDSGIVFFRADFFPKNGSSIPVEPRWYDDPKFTGTYDMSIDIPQSVVSGEYALGDIWMKDERGNETRYQLNFDWNKWVDLSNNDYIIDIDINNGNNQLFVSGELDYDKTPPVINRVSFPNSIKKPGVLDLSIDFREDETGIYRIYGYFQCRNDYEQIEFNKTWDSDFPYTGNCSIQVPVSSDTDSEEFYLSSIEITDQAGNKSYYDYDTSSGDWWVHGGDKKNISAGTNSLIVENEFEIYFQSSLNAPDLIAKLEAMPEGRIAFLNYSNSLHTVKKEVFEAIKGKDKTIILSDDGVQWRFNGKDIENAKEINCAVRITVEPLEEYGIQDDLLCLNFAQNGQLPGKATIRVKSDYISLVNEIPGKMYLYYLKENEKVQFESDVKDIPDGDEHWYEFDLTHNSRFAVSGNKLSSLIMKDSTLRLEKGKTGKLTVITNPSSLKKKLKWKSSDKKVVTVDSKGNVRAVGFGSAIITVKHTGKKLSNSCYVVVGYGVTYHLNGGTNNKKNPNAFYKETLKLKKPSRKGYLFKGWYSDSGFKNKVTKITKKQKKNLTLYAKWKKIKA